jgi:hypothetical protein
MNRALLIIALLIGGIASADVPRSFPAGSGARYAFSSSVGAAELTVSIAESSSNRVVVEFYFAQHGLLPSEMWQQFVLDLPAGGAPVVSEGYLITGEGRAPERIPADLLRGLEDASVSDFLFASRADIDRYRKADERVQVPAAQAPIASVRYEQTSGAQTITFWISDDAKPIGLVKLRSRGAKASQNYQLELASLLAHVGRKIDRSKAVPISAESRALLQTKLR